MSAIGRICSDAHREAVAMLLAAGPRAAARLSGLIDSDDDMVAWRAARDVLQLASALAVQLSDDDGDGGEAAEILRLADGRLQINGRVYRCEP